MGAPPGAQDVHEPQPSYRRLPARLTPGFGSATDCIIERDYVKRRHRSRLMAGAGGSASTRDIPPELLAGLDRRAAWGLQLCLSQMRGRAVRKLVRLIT